MVPLCARIDHQHPYWRKYKSDVRVLRWVLSAFPQNTAYKRDKCCTWSFNLAFPNYSFPCWGIRQLSGLSRLILQPLHQQQLAWFWQPFWRSIWLDLLWCQKFINAESSFSTLSSCVSKVACNLWWINFNPNWLSNKKFLVQVASLILIEPCCFLSLSYRPTLTCEVSLCFPAVTLFIDGCSVVPSDNFWA